jgi:hypothetical protein
MSVMSYPDPVQTGGATSLRQSLQVFAQQCPEDAALAADFLAFVQPEHFLRSSREGHFTGSAWLVSADGTRVLLTHHRKLGRWLQLGGHADGDTDLGRVAWREAIEESGIEALVLMHDIFDLDRHRIPARADEPEHWHYDVRYVVRAVGNETFVVGEESLELAWLPVIDVARDADPSLRRMARRWLAFNGYSGPAPD